MLSSGRMPVGEGEGEVVNLVKELGTLWLPPVAKRGEEGVMVSEGTRGEGGEKRGLSSGGEGRLSRSRGGPPSSSLPGKLSNCVSSSSSRASPLLSPLLPLLLPPSACLARMFKLLEDVEEEGACAGLPLPLPPPPTPLLLLLPVPLLSPG